MERTRGDCGALDARLAGSTVKDRTWRTSEIAREVGVRPNTVRLYETRGFLSPIPRCSAGYRLFSEDHVLDQPALRGILNRLWDLNLTLISVNPVLVTLSREEANR